MNPTNDPQPWTVETSEYLYQLPWFTVRQEAVTLPNGGHIPDYYLLDYPNWVNVVAVTTEGQLVFIRQYRHGIAGVHYELPAGTVDPGEDPLATAQRELLEETGFGSGEWELLMTVSANPSTHTNLLYAFLAIGVTLEQTQDLETTEEIMVHLVSPEQARDIVNTGEMIQSMHLAPLLKYLLNRESPAAEE